MQGYGNSSSIPGGIFGGSPAQAQHQYGGRNLNKSSPGQARGSAWEPDFMDRLSLAEQRDTPRSEPRPTGQLRGGMMDEEDKKRQEQLARLAHSKAVLAALDPDAWQQYQMQNEVAMSHRAQQVQMQRQGQSQQARMQQQMKMHRQGQMLFESQPQVQQQAGRRPQNQRFGGAQVAGGARRQNTADSSSRGFHPRDGRSQIVFG